MRLEQCPRDCWDWITADDVVRHALAAYYAASRAVEVSEGPWLDAQYGGWSSRADFRDQLWGFFRQRVNVQAHESGIRSTCSVELRHLPLPMLWNGESLSVIDQFAIGVAAGGRS